jgi:hypothetical protein
MKEYSNSKKNSTIATESLTLPAGALYGLVGRIVREIEPNTEADPAAILVQLLVAFGNVIDNSAHFEVDGVRHALNLFVVLVGATAKGRKGTSWARVRNLFQYLDDDDWNKKRVQSGLSSGEGLIWAVHDPIETETPKKEESEGEGVEDKRLLVVESEFASVLKMCGREGNVLSTVLRQAWDSQDLQILTKNSPHRATRPHISFIGHVTRDELLRNITATEHANGFGNRFLWIYVRRSKLLPDGGAQSSDVLDDLAASVSFAIEFAKTVGLMERDSEARALWHQVYPVLSGDRPGLFGAITARAEAQTMRLACLYAVLDRSTKVRVEHLKAALAVWDYAESSAKHIFGDALGDATADTILTALRQRGPLTRTAISALFKNNQSSGEIARALSVLEAEGLAKGTIDGTGAGRPAETWAAIQIG